jgi:hypothetical protein
MTAFQDTWRPSSSPLTQPIGYHPAMAQRTWLDRLAGRLRWGAVHRFGQDPELW